MKSSLMSAGLAFVLSASAFAAAAIDVQSNVPAEVYLDGSLIGSTPMVVKGTSPGNHTIRVVDKDSKTSQFFEFENPLTADVQKTFVATFVKAPPKEVVIQERVIVPQVRREVVVVPRVMTTTVEREFVVVPPLTRTVTYVRDDFPLVRDYLSERSSDLVVDSDIVSTRDRVRTRNTALGVTGAGLLSGSSLLTGLGLGGLIINEMR